MSDRCVAVALLGCAMLAGCNSQVTDNRSGSSPAGPNPSVQTVQAAYLSPSPIVRPGPVSVSLDGQDVGRDGVTYRYRWYVNGILVPGELSARLATENLKRGDLVMAEVIHFSNERAMDVSYKTSALQIANTLPTVLTVGLPPQIELGEKVRAEVSLKDIDQDEIRARYRWWKNRDMVLETEEPVLELVGFARGDALRVSVIPHDGMGEGKEVSSPSITIGNSPPQFTSMPPEAVPKGSYQYRLSAVDPDGDPVSFEIESGPPGMVIDAKRAQLNWSIPAALVGSHRIKIIAKDDQGGQVSQEFDLVLPASSAS